MLGTGVEIGLRIAVPAAAGLCSLLIAVAVIRRRGPAANVYADLATPFGVMAALFGMCGLLYAGAWLGEAFIRQFQPPIAGPAMGVVNSLIVVPWTVFALRYVGRGRLVTSRRIGIAVILLGFGLVVDLIAFVDLFGLTDGQRRSIAVAASVLTLVVVGVECAVSWLVLASSSRHDRLSRLAGGVAVVPIVIPVFVFQVTRATTLLVNEVLTAAGFMGGAFMMWLGLTRYDLLADRPGTGTLGERAAVAEMDEPVFVVDRSGQIARANAAATAVFGSGDRTARLRDVVGFDIDELAGRDTVECQTVDGLRQFDPRVTQLRNGHDETLGYTLALFDVTAREIRRQRLQVLNRILRHNLRNRLDVIRAHAEEASNEPIIENADRLDQLSTEARRIETLMQRAGTLEASTHLPTVVDEVINNAVATDASVETAVDVPNVTLDVDRGLCRYALEQLVENAIDHNTGDHARVEVTGTKTNAGVRLVVADDGPGIPDSERDVISSGTEHDLAHASSLGLWGANWAVQTLGGDLAFESSELGGTGVVIKLPGQR